MRELLPMRRLIGGTPGVLLAMLMLFARLLGAPLPATADQAMPVGWQVICHTDAADGGTSAPTPARAPHQGECLLCPACHLPGQALVLLPGGPLFPPPSLAVVRLSAPPPPAIGPPARFRSAAQPTGPPTQIV